MQRPAATPVIVYVAAGPLATAVVTVAIPLHVSLSPNVPLYPVSCTMAVDAFAEPVP